uniref:NADH-ubiquinone oxidoreductase chain 4L n=1 Tax=Staphylinidae sp. BMNH 1274207 TaxID=1796558 RepID=A0A140EGS7_9COLE|nr:NADH dehydrogenase subunit 4L [Staphylinidae sp. BMNH 1274207]
MLMLLFISIFMYFVGLLIFLKKHKHFLLMLLSLEFIVLSLYLNMYLYLIYFNYEMYFVMIFLTMSVCEGVLGLSLLVSMIRSHGSDYFQSLSMLW